MSTRTPIPRRLRFAILERDGFTCCYCGAQAPEVRLHVDHVSPVSRGGGSTADNLVTACADCNLGKWAREPLARIPAQRAHAVAAKAFQRAAERFGQETDLFRAFETILDFCLAEEGPDKFLAIVERSHDWRHAINAMYDEAGFPPTEYDA